MLTLLTNATDIDLQQNVSLPCTEVESLDRSLDGTIDGNNGKVRYTCFTDSSKADLISALTNTNSALADCIVTATDGLLNVGDVRTLLCPNAGITDLAGLAALANLTEIDFSGNAITNYSDISNLRSLVSLALDNTGLSDVSVLSGLKNLQKLSLRSNPFTVIGDDGFTHYSYYNNYLSHLTNLVTLYMFGNQVINGVSSLGTLYKANVINFDCYNSAAPQFEINIKVLDQKFDKGNGPFSGVVTWGCG